MAYRLRRLLGEGGRSYEKFKESTRGDGLGTSMATWHTDTNSRYPVSRARVHIRPWSDGILEYCNRDSAQHSSIPPLPAVFDLNLRNLDLACCHRTHHRR